MDKFFPPYVLCAQTYTYFGPYSPIVKDDFERVMAQMDDPRVVLHSRGRLERAFFDRNPGIQAPRPK